MKKSIITFGLSFLLVVTVLSNMMGQNNSEVNVSFEELQTKCQKRPLKERVSLAVATFYVSTPTRTRGLGENMATQLTNALQKINCFRVLDMMRYNSIYEDERRGTRDSDPNHLPQSGKLRGAQVVITGEITEYANKHENRNTVISSSHKNLINLGFVLKMVNPETRDVLWSESVNVEGVLDEDSRFNLPIGRGNRKIRDIMVILNELPDNNRNSVPNVLEQGVLKACELLVTQIDELELPERPDPSLNRSLVILENVSYSGMQRMSALLRGTSGVAKVNPSFSGGKAEMMVYHKSKTNNLMGQLESKISRTYEVKTVVPGKIVLEAK